MTDDIQIPSVLVPRNWKKFQHYKDRSPPWIKLHRDLLNDRAFMLLALASKALAPLLWLLACESEDGSFSADLDELEFRLRMPKTDIKRGLEGLLRAGFFEAASGALAECLQPATSEREKEGETERETETEKKRGRVPRPDPVPEGLWQDFIKLRAAKKAPLTETAMRQIQAEAVKAKWPIERVIAECCTRGWAGFKASWVEREKPATSFAGVDYRQGGEWNQAL